ncbi:hypothetical protein Btru_066076 [Bulinus truncatus]|nr:hypothetical protein Btru_066076 [Bulinus truncatus]
MSIGNIVLIILCLLTSVSTGSVDTDEQWMSFQTSKGCLFRRAMDVVSDEQSMSFQTSNGCRFRQQWMSFHTWLALEPPDLRFSQASVPSGQYCKTGR